jgi:hypothetical protein
MGEVRELNLEEHKHGKVLASLPTGEKLILGKSKLSKKDVLFVNINGVSMYTYDMPKDEAFEKILMNLAEQVIKAMDTNELPKDKTFEAVIQKVKEERAKRKRTLINAVLEQEEPTGTDG